MKKINTDHWKNYKISDIFITEKRGVELQVPTGAYIEKSKLLEGDTPRITVTGTNNGIFGYFKNIENDPNYRIYENFISVSFLGTVFYQKGMASLDMKVHCLKPINIELNENIGKFLVSVILASLQKSTYSDQISSTVLPDVMIKLPCRIDGSPDWQYMENYIKFLENSIKEELLTLNELKQLPNKKINYKKYNYYPISYFFDVLKIREKLTQKDIVDDGIIPVHSSETLNNGIQGYTKCEPHFCCDDKNLIYLVFGDHTKSMNFATYNFCVMDNVKVLKPKIMDLYVLQYIVTVWKKAIPDLGYARHWSVAKNVLLKLPSDNLGNPDYRFMHEYMESIKSRLKNKINELS